MLFKFECFFFQSWIKLELECSVGVAEARLSLNKLIDERKVSAVELAELEDKRPVMESTIANDNVSDQCEDTSNAQQQQQQLIAHLKQDIQFKSLLINQIQQMVIEGGCVCVFVMFND